MIMNRQQMVYLYLPAASVFLLPEAGVNLILREVNFFKNHYSSNAT